MGSQSPWEDCAKVLSLNLSDSKSGSRKVNLQSHFDPKKLAEEAVGLNIRLMLWRAAPNLNVDVLSDTRCLLIGKHPDLTEGRIFL